MLQILGDFPAGAGRGAGREKGSLQLLIQAHGASCHDVILRYNFPREVGFPGEHRGRQKAGGPHEDLGAELGVPERLLPPCPLSQP